MLPRCRSPTSPGWRPRGTATGHRPWLRGARRPVRPWDAVVFLDSTVEYRPLDEFESFKASLERNRNSTVPVVMFADRRRHPHWESFDPYLQFAARYEAAVDGMDHNDFVSQGATGKGEAVRRTYEAICQVILRFLNGHLKGDAEALKSLRDAGTPGLVQVAYKAARPAPPTSAQVAKMY